MSSYKSLECISALLLKPYATAFYYLPDDALYHDLQADCIMQIISCKQFLSLANTKSLEHTLAN